MVCRAIVLQSAFFLLLLSFLPGWSASAHDGVTEMSQSAERLLATLSESQKQQCVFQYDDPKRTAWNFVPDKFIQPDGRRYGLVLSDMSSQQRLLTHSLLSSVLSAEGIRQTVTIMSLEQVLHELENSNPIRDPQRYYVSFFGSPEDDTWGWRFEGHHLSLNFTVENGDLLLSAPAFFGTNPGQVRQGEMKGLQVLKAEETLARDFLATLDANQRPKAIVDQPAPADVQTGTAPVVDLDVLSPDSNAGIKVEELSDQQSDLLQGIVNEYLSAYQEHAIGLTPQQRTITEDTVFAWLGSTEPGKGHYYRIRTPHLLLEYDNTQNDANHVHLVIRNLNQDFGADWLQQHRKQAHPK